MCIVGFEIVICRRTQVPKELLCIILCAHWVRVHHGCASSRRIWQWKRPPTSAIASPLRTTTTHCGRHASPISFALSVKPMRHKDISKPSSLQVTVSNWSQGSRRHEPSRSAPTRHASPSATTVAEPHMRDSFFPTYSPMSPTLDTRPTSPADIRHLPLSHPSFPRRTFTPHRDLPYYTPCCSLRTSLTVAPALLRELRLRSSLKLANEPL